MKTREDWKTMIDEIGGLVDKFMKIKADSESLLMDAKRIALTSIDEAKELAELAKTNMSSVVSNFMGQDEVSTTDEREQGNESQSNDQSDMQSNGDSKPKIKVTRAKSRNLDTHN